MVSSKILYSLQSSRHCSCWIIRDLEGTNGWNKDKKKMLRNRYANEHQAICPEPEKIIF